MRASAYAQHGGPAASVSSLTRVHPAPRQQCRELIKLEHAVAARVVRAAALARHALELRAIRLRFDPLAGGHLRWNAAPVSCAGTRQQAEAWQPRPQLGAPGAAGAGVLRRSMYLRHGSSVLGISEEKAAVRRLAYMRNLDHKGLVEAAKKKMLEARKLGRWIMPWGVVRASQPSRLHMAPFE